MPTVFKQGKAAIGIMDTPNQLRLNRVKGMFASGNIDSQADIERTGRGTWIEGLILHVDLNLYGIIGKENKQEKDYIFVHLLVTNSQSPKVEKGVVYSFLMTGFEARDVAQAIESKMLQMEMASIMGTKMDMAKEKVRIEFPDTPIKVNEGKYFYPIISFLPLTKEEKDYGDAVDVILNNYKEKLPNPTRLFEATFDENGQLVSGLLPASNEVAVLEGKNEMPMLESA